MHRVIVVGSPRAEGRSAHLADELFNACIEECPEDGVSIVSVASTEVRPCTGCGACAAKRSEPLFTFEEGDPLTSNDTVLKSDAQFHACVIDDDMNEVRKHLDAADELIVVSPVYFSGAPAQMKALLDRLQPYFESDLRRVGKRPMVLHVVGEGGDPHGFAALVSEVRSAFAVAGFRLELVLDWTGRIDQTGEIVAEAEEFPIPPLAGYTPASADAQGAAFEDEGEDGFAAADDAYGFADEDEDAEDEWPDGVFGEFAEDDDAFEVSEPACAQRSGKSAPAPRSDREQGKGRSKLSLADAEPRKKRAQAALDDDAAQEGQRKRRGNKNQHKKGPKPNSRQSNGHQGSRRSGGRRRG